MEVTLQVRSGDAAGMRFLVEAGATLSIGRSPPAQVQLNDDPMLSNPHFQIEFNEVCRLKDLASKFGTKVNGQAVSEAVLKDGDQIVAGQTRFAIRIRSDAATGTTTATLPPPAPVPITAQPIAEAPAIPKPRAALPVLNEPLSKPQASVLRHLRSQTPTLYGLFDAAREPSIVMRLQASGLEHQSLYDGAEGEQLAPYGPWLVRFPRDAVALEEFVSDGWGRSWGVYVACDRSLKELRRHLRQFLMVKLPDARQVYFRYYDPRVLRVYLATCTADEVAKFIGPITRYIVESISEQELLEFGSNHNTWRKVEIGK